ncbi:unnamed protein product [Alopecurus aequalis]
MPPSKAQSGKRSPRTSTNHTSPVQARIDVVIKTGVATSLFVSKDGSTQFSAIQQAVDSIPATNAQWVRIHVSPGIYREKVTISKAFVLLEGEGQAQTSIEWDDFEVKEGNVKGLPPRNTNETATLFIKTTDFMARHITFKNTYDGGNDTAPAVAVQVLGDRVAFYDCGFVSVQDTLSDLTGKHYYKDCLLEGAIDFIFGYGISVFQGCELRTVQLPPGRSPGFITAQGRDSPADHTAFVFKECTVGGITPVYLGRAWRAYSQVFFYRTIMSNIIVPWGWDVWNAKGNEATLFLVESECTGPGSDRSGRVPWSKGLSSTDPEVVKYLNPAYNDDDLWIEAQPQ